MDAMDKFDWKIIQALQKWTPDESGNRGFNRSVSLSMF